MVRRSPLDMAETPVHDAVRIMTIHASKGREFAVVFLADLAQRKFSADSKKKDFFVPFDLVRELRAGYDERPLRLQEERHLCYGIGGDNTKKGSGDGSPSPRLPDP